LIYVKGGACAGSAVLKAKLDKQLLPDRSERTVAAEVSGETLQDIATARGI
jgi:hypothetical protein